MLSESAVEKNKTEDRLGKLRILETPPLIPEKKALITRALDFWMLGGISFVAWMFSMMAAHGSELNEGFDRQVQSWPYAFSALAVICNYPHFMSSYRIAYGNGIKKIFKHWFTLILIPTGLVALFCASYFMHAKTYEGKFFQTEDLGSDLMRVGVWMMWLTIGWHYSKQTFGVMLKYAAFDGYSISKTQKNILRYCLLLVVPANFFEIMPQMKTMSSGFQDLSMVILELPKWTLLASSSMCVVMALVFVGCLVQNYVARKQVPSINFIVPFVAFYLWWYPGFWPQPYALIMVPFFHSLQYLPFAYKRIESDLSPKSRAKFSTIITLNIIVMLLVGFLLFDIIPTWLDVKIETRFEFGSSFFMISALLFLNIHHFFMDSSIWRSKKLHSNT